jgi:hypothetical protein
MIIKHNSPRKTPDLYSEELYNEICSDLGVQDNQQKIYFKETIEQAALFLIKIWQKNPKKLTDGEEKAELKRLAKSLKKTRKILDELCNKEHLGKFRLFGAMNLNKTPDEIETTKILKEILGSYHTNTQAISFAFEALEKTALNAVKNNCVFERENKKTTIVLQWIWKFSDDWEEISNIRFAKGVDYNSPSMRILKKMIDPINEELLGKKPEDESEKKITDSMIEQAVIMHKQYQKDHPEEKNDMGDFI